MGNGCIRLADRVRLTFEGSEIFKDGTTLTGEVMGLDPILVDVGYSVGCHGTVLFGPDSYREVKPYE